MARRREREYYDPPRAGPEEFIKAWQGSETLGEVARKVRCRKGAVRMRAWRYRQRGIPLKQLDTEPLPDWDWLAEYAQSLLPGDDGGDDAGDDGEGGAADGEDRPA